MFIVLDFVPQVRKSQQEQLSASDFYINKKYTGE